jgi:DNA polymerase-3 subunit alpha
MAEYAKYGFGKAHAVAYAMITYWTAWWKVHYPVAFLTAVLSTADKERVPDFVQEARRLSVAVLPPDINASGKGFRPHDNTIRYGLDAIKGVGTKAVEAITEGQPYTSFEDCLERKGAKANSGVTMLLAKVGAFDTVYGNRRALVERLEAEKDGTSTTCRFKNPAGTNEHGLPCTFDWASEPVPVNIRTGKNLKVKPPPKKCTKACRQYLAPEPTDLGIIPPYTERDIREIEQEMLGVQLSSTVFDALEEADRTLLRSQAELLDRGIPGIYIVGGVISRVRPHRDRTGRDMAFIGLSTETVEIDMVCFADTYAKESFHVKPGNFVICEVRRDQGGVSLKTINPLDA